MLDRTLQIILILGISFIIIAGITISIGLNDLNQTHENMEEFEQWQSELQPQSDKESLFIDSLKNERLFLTIQKPFFDRLEAENQSINLTIESGKLAYPNAESSDFTELRAQLVSKYYHNILPDSLREKVRKINVSFLIPDRINGGNCDTEEYPDFNFDYTFSKSQLDSL